MFRWSHSFNFYILLLFLFIYLCATHIRYKNIIFSPFLLIGILNENYNIVFVCFFLSLEFVCPGNYSKCDDGLQCVYVSELCNGWSRCKDGSDESESWCKGIDINYTHNQFNIYYYNGSRICFGGPMKSDIVLINVHDP